jgi:flagellar biosynthesis chaperone FliJ
VRRDRLQVVLQVRELFERRRLAEQAAADQQVRAAEAQRLAAEEARAAAAVRPGAACTGELHQQRLAGLALHDAVDVAAGDERLARNQAERAEQRRVEASKARRSAERLHERRSSEAALLASKVAQRQLDAVALEGWRRRA